MTDSQVLALLGYLLVVLATLHTIVGALLLRRPLRRKPMIGPAAATCWLLAISCLAAGIAYVDAANGLDPEMSYRIAWCAWLPVVAGIQMLLVILDPSGRVARRFAWIGYPVAGLVAALAVFTDLVQAGPPQLLPFRDSPGPLSGPIEFVGALVLLTFLVLAATAWHRMPDDTRQRASRLILGLVATGLTALAFQVANGFSSNVDTALSLLGSVFWTAGVVAALGPRGLFDLDVAAVHVGLVLLWGTVIALLQLALWTLLSPPLPGGAALFLSCIVVVLFAYAVLPLSRRTLDRLDALMLSGRNRRPVLQQCMRAAVTYLDLDQLLDYLSRTLVREVGISAVAFLLENDQGALEPQHAQNALSDQGLPPGSALASWLRRERRTLQVDDLADLDDPAERDALKLEFATLRADLVLPMMCKGRLLGLLALGPMASGAHFDSDDVEMLSALGDQAAIAVENARLFRTATTDGLTGLFQRTYFVTRLKEELDRSHRYGRTASLLMLDIDHFKRVNDRFGHAEGDHVLKEVGALLRRGLRSSDLACRYGGEEFVVLLPEASGELASRVAERLREAAAEASIGQAGTVTLSIGVAEMFPNQAPESLIQQADVAMYQAKRSGRNRVVLWRSRSRETAHDAEATEAARECD